MGLVARDLSVWFGPHFVGMAVGAIWSDDTGYGAFHPAEALQDCAALRRVREYIAFSEGWHERLLAESGYSRSEWDAFEDVYGSPLWHAAAPDGSREQVSGPVFFGGDITWGPAKHAEPGAAADTGGRTG